MLTINCYFDERNTSVYENIRNQESIIENIKKFFFESKCWWSSHVFCLRSSKFWHYFVFLHGSRIWFNLFKICNSYQEFVHQIIKFVVIKICSKLTWTICKLNISFQFCPRSSVGMDIFLSNYPCKQQRCYDKSILFGSLYDWVSPFEDCLEKCNLIALQMQKVKSWEYTINVKNHFHQTRFSHYDC